MEGERDAAWKCDHRVDLAHVWGVGKASLWNQAEKRMVRETRWESGWCNDPVVFWVVWGAGGGAGVLLMAMW